MTLTINRNHNVHLKVGERVICVKRVEFVDGTIHRIGEEFTVGPKDSAYFSLFTAERGVNMPEHCAYMKL